MFKKLVLIIFAGAIACSAIAQQTKEEIQKKQQQLQRELAELNSTLGDIKKNKKQSLSQLALVQRKIKAREELVYNINKELHKLDDEIYLNNLDIYRYKRELDTLKGKYAKSLMFAYKNRSSYDYLNFIFSANSFNDAMKRVSYLKSYRQFRETQVSNILKTQNLLQTKIGNLKNSMSDKNNSLTEQGKQIKEMETDRKEKDEVVKDLQGQEKELSGQISEREKTRKKLNTQLQDIVKREIAEARKKEIERQQQIAKQKEEDRKKKALADAQAKAQQQTSGDNTVKTAPPVEEPIETPKPRNSTRTYSPLESTEENVITSVNFEKRNLPWPVSSGSIITPFGVTIIPGTKMKISSDGIDIGVPVGSTVKCVADGTVTGVVDGGQAVFVRHGKYFTVYSNLSNASVNKNDKVQAGTVIGKAGAGGDGGGLLFFEVMNENGSFLNPESWLKR